MLSEFFDFAQVGGKRGRRKGTKKGKKARKGTKKRRGARKSRGGSK